MFLTYRSLDEAQAAHLPPHIRKVVCRCLQDLIDAYGDEYDPEDDGYVVLYSEDTTDQDALDLFGRMFSLTWGLLKCISCWSGKTGLRYAWFCRFDRPELR